MHREPRVKPLADEEMSQEQLELTANYRRGGKLPNVFRVALRNTELFRAYKPFGLFTMAQSSVAPRFRELAILRVALNARCDYEWGQHVLIARWQKVLSPEEIERIRLGADAAGWTAVEAGVLRMVDQIRSSSDLDDDTYGLLLGALGEAALVELINTIGNYAMVASVLNIFGVPLDDGVKGIDAPVTD